MNISSENIVDVFLRKISESLPVGERDEYQDWQREHDNMVKMPARIPEVAFSMNGLRHFS